MVHVITRHKVKDYSVWKPLFDGHEADRNASGQSGSPQLFHVQGDPNDLVVLLKWDSVENLNKFFAGPAVKAAMQEAGVVSEPEITILEEL